MSDEMKIEEPPFITEDNLLFVYDALSEAHALLLRYSDHGGSNHCQCHLAELIRQISQHYDITLLRLTRKRSKKKRTPK